MISRSFLIVVFLVFFYEVASAQDFFCKEQNSSDGFKKEFSLSIVENKKYLLAMVPFGKNGNGDYDFCSDTPVELGQIEISDTLRDSKLLIAKGRFIITDKKKNIVAGILINEGRQYSIRLDFLENVWNFILHDTNHKETVTGICE